MNIETTKAEIHEMVETMQNESFLNRTHAQLKHFKEAEKDDIKSNYTAEEYELIEKINAAVPADIFARYHELYLKYREEKNTQKENEELKKLAYLLEKYNVERLTYMIHLSALWQTTVDEVMRRLNIHPPEDL